MDNKQEFEKIFSELMNGFDEARKKMPDITVEQFIADMVSQLDFSDEQKKAIDESFKFIDELDKNTASLMKSKSTAKWVEDNVYGSMSEVDRTEFEKGVDDVAKLIKDQTINIKEVNDVQ